MLYLSLLNVENSIGIIAAIIATIGIVLTLFQLFQTKKIKKAEIISDLLKSIRSNPRISRIEYLLEYGETWYDNSFHESEIELYIDDFLAHFNYICFLLDKKYIGKKEFEMFEYELGRIANNYDCLCYLWNLYHWCLSQNKKCSFSYLISFIKKQMSKEKITRFESSKEEMSGFTKYLNFD